MLKQELTAAVSGSLLLLAVVATAATTTTMLTFFPNSCDAADLGSSMAAGKRYWSIMEESPPIERLAANEALLDYAVGTINTQYYDNTGGARFNTKDFYKQWKALKQVAEQSQQSTTTTTNNNAGVPADISLQSREGAVQGLKWLVNSLEDPFSKYLTRDELNKELQGDSYGFLGTGAVVEPPHAVNDNNNKYSLGSSILLESSSSSSLSLSSSSSSTTTTQQQQQQQQKELQQHSNRKKKFLTVTRVANLPVITAVSPDSPAERAGLVVGDRIVAVGDVEFLGWTRPEVAKVLQTKYNAESYMGYAQLTVAKPVYSLGIIGGGEMQQQQQQQYEQEDQQQAVSFEQQQPLQEVVVGYRQARVLVPSKASEPGRTSLSASSSSSTTSATTTSTPTVISGGDAIVHYELLSSSSGSIFDHLHSDDAPPDEYKVGYIRLTRFSKKSTEGYLKAIQELEAAGAQSYILDLRNNYGGVIQEAMLTASTLLRDPHSILCFTMNARGGFTPHDVEEYVVDKRYPGYLLSKESTKATIDQVRRETPEMFIDSGINWNPPSSFASLHEQITKRGIKRMSMEDPIQKRRSAQQKKIVLLINEGTASSAEVFTAALRDNARTVALVGTRTYGKGLIQHTFPMPDGGGLRITVAEYLTPALRHVTHVGGARFDHGSLVGGGIRPDISCESKQGIPGNIRADLCVGVALDALEEAAAAAADESDVGNNKLVAGPFALSLPSSILGSRH